MILRFARMVMTACLALMLGGVVARTSNAATDSELIRGFNLTVFGAEFAPFGIQSHYIRKFPGPVRIKVHNISSRDRVNTINRFVQQLNQAVEGLTVSTTTNDAAANFHVYVVDQKDYVKVAREQVYRRPTASIPGKCLVRSVFSRAGISRSDAVIVSDGGESLFRRCMIEEILQGLGPLNEHPSLAQSMFNDFSRHTSFTRFDRTILNMLYDRRIRNGATLVQVQGLLPTVLRDARRNSR